MACRRSEPLRREPRVPLHGAPFHRFAAARRAGFEAVEFPWPADPPAAVAERVADAGLGVALLNMESGDLTAGERGYASDPGRVEEWRAAFDAAAAFVDSIGHPGFRLELDTYHVATIGDDPAAIVGPSAPLTVTSRWRMRPAAALRADEPGPGAPLVAHMEQRAAVVRAATPELLIDTDNWAFPNLATRRAYLARQPALGIPRSTTREPHRPVG